MAETNRRTALDVLDVERFLDEVVGGYNDGVGPQDLPADEATARSLIPTGTADLRDFSYIAPDIPQFRHDACVGCMDCVTECPDTAILAKVVAPDVMEKHLADIPDGEHRKWTAAQFAETVKYGKNFEKKGETPGRFGLFVDPTKCKGCGECVLVCGDRKALEMIAKDEENLKTYRVGFDFFRRLPETPEKYILERSLQDMMLAERSLLFTGGAGSCMGCGETTALRMLLAATGFVYGKEGVAVVAATGCNTVYASTYPYNPFRVPWSNSLFENVATFAMGVRGRWNQLGWQDKRLWAVGGDGAMVDIGFQPLSRLLASGMDVNVIILDTQAYSNTGGQASTASFHGQDAKMAAHGKAIPGKTEQRKELANICMMHPDAYVAQTTPALANHFYKSIIGANEFRGPSVVNVYTTCQPEHGVGDACAAQQEKLAVTGRAFPVFVYDPRQGELMRERLSLTGNPATKEDWYTNPKTKEVVDFVAFARTEGRFAKQFDKEGRPSEILLAAQEDRRRNWRRLQELAGVL